MLKLLLNTCLVCLNVHIGMYLCLNFGADSEPIKGNNATVVCYIGQPSFTSSVSILKDGSSKSICDNANNCNPPSSDSDRYQYFSNISSVYVEISNLSHSTDSGIWKCKIGTIEKEHKLVVNTIPMSTEFTQTIPDSNSSELVENVKLSGRCYCIFPPPSEVKLYFRVGTGSFQFLERIPDPFVNKRNETSSCESYEFDVEVSSFTVEMMGKTNVFFEMHFGDYKTSGVVGPFSFSFKAGCNYSDTELFFGGFSCFLIVLITTIIMLIILACKMLPKIFGDLSTKKKTIKIIIIVVFIVVALIIGLALGFGLKECNQRNLGLGLGLGLGFLLAIALVVTLFIYHRQCDSKKENEDENRESQTEIQSKKPEDNHKRVGSPASASNVKMESKLNS